MGRGAASRNSSDGKMHSRGFRSLALFVTVCCLTAGVCGQVEDGASKSSLEKVSLRGAGSLTLEKDPSLKPEQHAGSSEAQQGNASPEALSAEAASRVASINLAKAPPLKPRVAPVTVAFLTILMALATGLGSVPFFFLDMKGKGYGGVCNGMACGVMLAASFGLLHEGEAYGGAECVVLGVLLGGLFILASQKVRTITPLSKLSVCAFVLFNLVTSRY